MKESIPVSSSDGELVAEFARRRDERAFSELVRRHGGMVLSVCRSVLGNTPDAEDAAQAVFLTLAQKSGSGQVQGHLVGWLHRVAWYVAAREAEAKATRRRHEREAALMKKEAEVNAGSPVDLSVLHAALASLPEKYREALILHHLEGRSHAAAAASLGCSVDALAVRLHRGREMIRQRLEKRRAAVSMAVLAGMWATPAMGALPAMFERSVTTAAKAAAGGALSTAASGQVLTYVRWATDMLFWKKMKAGVLAAAMVLFAGVLAGAVLTARGGAAGAEVRPAGPTSVITGLIARVDADEIAIHRQNGQTVSVRVNAATVVTVDGFGSAAAELRTNMEAAAFVEDGRPAREIRARRPGASQPAK